MRRLIVVAVEPRATRVAEAVDGDSSLVDLGAALGHGVLWKLLANPTLDALTHSGEVGLRQGEVRAQRLDVAAKACEELAERVDFEGLELLAYGVGEVQLRKVWVVCHGFPRLLSHASTDQASIASVST